MRRRRNDADTHALFEANRKRAQEGPNVKDLSVDEIFAVITREGSRVFLPMIENSIRRIVREEIEAEFKRVADGLLQGLQDLQITPYDFMKDADGDVDDDEPEEHQGVGSTEPTSLSPDKAETRHYQSWSEEEDMALIGRMNRAMHAGRAKESVYREHAEEFGRTPGSVAWRWNSVIKSKYPELIEE